MLVNGNNTKSLKIIGEILSEHNSISDVDHRRVGSDCLVDPGEGVRWFWAQTIGKL